MHGLIAYAQLQPAQQRQARELVNQPHLFLYRVEQGEVTRAYYQAAVVRGMVRFLEVKGR